MGMYWPLYSLSDLHVVVSDALECKSPRPHSNDAVNPNVNSLHQWVRDRLFFMCFMLFFMLKAWEI